MASDVSQTLNRQRAEWRVSPGLVAYEDAVAFMEQRVAAIAAGTAPQCVWLLQHPALYTAGTSARPGDLLAADRFPVHKTGRGGQYTYHGPGQRVVYVMLDLRNYRCDVRAYVKNLERWIIAALARMDVAGVVRDGRVGVWVERAGDGASREEKIAAIGVRIRKWVTYHGISLNVAPDLEHFSGIVPCGLEGYGVTSLKALGRPTAMDRLDNILKATFEDVFALRAEGPSPIQPANGSGP